MLGIHWLADIIAGLAVGALSVGIAWRFTDTSERHELALESEYRSCAGSLVQRGLSNTEKLAEPGDSGASVDGSG